jgi:hypothetical protein
MSYGADAVNAVGSTTVYPTGSGIAEFADKYPTPDLTMGLDDAPTVCLETGGWDCGTAGLDTGETDLGLRLYEGLTGCGADAGGANATFLVTGAGAPGAVGWGGALAPRMCAGLGFWDGTDVVTGACTILTIGCDAVGLLTTTGVLGGTIGDVFTFFTG